MKVNALTDVQYMANKTLMLAHEAAYPNDDIKEEMRGVDLFHHLSAKLYLPDAASQALAYVFELHSAKHPKLIME